MRQDATDALQPAPTSADVVRNQVAAADAEVRRLTNRSRAARAQHLALATVPRTSHDRIEAARCTEREAATDLAEGEAAPPRHPHPRISCERRASSTAEVERFRGTIDGAIDRKVINAVRNLAPYLTTALGPRPPRNDTRREHWNHAAAQVRPSDYVRDADATVPPIFGERNLWLCGQVLTVKPRYSASSATVPALRGRFAPCPVCVKSHPSPARHVPCGHVSLCM